MVIWNAQFRIFKPLKSFPRPLVVASERRFDASYHHEGRFRQNERSCLFKYTLAGEGIFRDADGEHRIPAGYGFLCRICDPATAYYYPTDGQEPWEFVYINFVSQATIDMTTELVEKFGPVFKLPRECSILAKMQSYRHFSQTYVHISATEGVRLIMELITALVDSQELTLHENPSALLSMRAMDAIENHLESNLNVTDLAKILGVSREHLTRVFKEETALTPLKYITRQKILLACHLLKETSMTAKQISHKLGYNAPAHFIRAFKNSMKMTPRQFRDVGIIPIQ